MNPSAGASTAAGPIAVGAVLSGRYRIVARLGAGGMATIYRGIDESLERDVAVKVLHAHLADDPSLMARFRAEARAAAGLLHPNIVNVFDQGVAELPFIVMEYVDGPSLREVLVRRGRLSPGEVLAIAGPISRALARAHAAGVIHRDIKPENVLIAADGTPKVADFGIARAVAETSHTATGTLVGSVHYLAPELMGGAEATPGSDQYSLGVVLFELLTGRKPLPAETPMAVAMRHARERIPSVRDFVSDAPAAVDGVIAKATQVDPRKRYPDMQALAAALDHAVPGGPQPVVIEPETGDNEHTLIIPVEAETTLTVPTAKPRRVRRRPHLPRLRRRRATTTDRHRRRWLVPLLLGLLAIGGAALWNWGIAPVRAVPTLVRATEAQAAAALAEQGLTLEVVGTRHDHTVAAGAIVEQDPGPGETARKGGVVTVVLSDGPAEVTLPDVVGQPGKRSVERLEGEPLFLVVETVRVYSDTIPRGRVVAQQPPGDRTVLQGSEVTLRVSRGIEQVEVPNVEGLTQSEAEAALAEAKLEVEITEKFSDKVPEAGRVIKQDTAAESTVDKGTLVTLTVSKGPVTITLDDYRGQTIGQAQSALGALGMEVVVLEEARPRIGPFRRGSYGLVEEQVPEAGSSLKRGETVTLYTFSEAADEAQDDDAEDDD